MTRIDNIDALDALYGPASPRSLTKVTQRITPLYRQWITASRFCIVSTVGPAGTDGSPRGDDGPVVQIADDTTLLLPDWRGNNRLDTLRNIVADGRISLMFLVPGSSNVVRVNGTAFLTADPAMQSLFDQRGQHPRTVAVITASELYFQCAKAVMRSDLWSGTTARDDLPTAGEFLREMDEGFDAAEYDTGYADYAKSRVW